LAGGPTVACPRATRARGAKITGEILPTIDLRAELGTHAEVESGYDLVTARMLDALGQLASLSV
jgi:hypothetical protein